MEYQRVFAFDTSYQNVILDTSNGRRKRLQQYWILDATKLAQRTYGTITVHIVSMSLFSGTLVSRKIGAPKAARCIAGTHQVAGFLLVGEQTQGSNAVGGFYGVTKHEERETGETKQEHFSLINSIQLN